jgi:flavin reductase (DIM6/NTAB) family NADH-FMN oxidoreductase RutF
MRTPVELDKAYRLLNHGPVVLVSSAHGKARNVMAAAWSMPIDFLPPKVAVVVDSRSFSRELIEASGEFAINIPCRNQIEAVLKAGTASGRDTDKFAHTGFGAFAGECIAAPLIEGCAGWLECRVIPEPNNEKRYDLFIGEVIAAQADDRVFRDGHWDMSNDDLRTLHYLSGGTFFATGDAITIASD